jgi:hypothetical protein
MVERSPRLRLLVVADADVLGMEVLSELIVISGAAPGACPQLNLYQKNWHPKQLHLIFGAAAMGLPITWFVKKYT